MRAAFPMTLHCMEILALTVLLSVAGASAQSQQQNNPTVVPLELQKLGEARALPHRILGASVEPFFEHILDDPAKIAAVRDMQPAFVRFPGGTQSNYYNWRTGLFAIHVNAESSAYSRFWDELIPKICRGFPQGITLQQYKEFARQVGAAVVLVPNLETSSIPEQVAWFKQLQADNAIPRHIELGNEFWVAMGNDPNVLKHWPDTATSMRIMKEYAQALRPFFPEGTKVAVQAAAAAFSVPPHAASPFARHLQQWDEDLRPADWFDAVTVHLYTKANEIMGKPGAGAGFARRNDARPLYDAFMARCDEGVDRVLADIEHRVPGKEIWVTEWNPHGGSILATDGEPTPAMKMQLVSRMTFAYLRHPAVTMSLYFNVNFRANDRRPALLPTDGQGGFTPTPTAVVLGWFNQAANGGVSYQRITEPQALKIPGNGRRQESYAAIEGGLFISPKRTTLILQNATERARRPDLHQQVAGNPKRIEVLTVADFFDARGQASVTTVPAEPALLMPPFSLARVIWE